MNTNRQIQTTTLTSANWSVNAFPKGEASFEAGDTIEITLATKPLTIGSSFWGLTFSKVVIDGINFYLDMNKSDAASGKLVFTYTIQKGVTISTANFNIDKNTDITLDNITYQENGKSPDFSGTLFPIELTPVEPSLLTTVDTKNVTVSGEDQDANDFVKTSDTSQGWDNSEVTSIRGFVGDGFVTAKITSANSNIMFGVTDKIRTYTQSQEDTKSQKLYHDMDNAIYLEPGQLNSAYEDGVQKSLTKTITNYKAGDSVKIERVGDVINYYHITGGTEIETLLRTVRGVTTEKLYFKAVFYSANSGGLEDVILQQKITMVVDNTVAPTPVTWSVNDLPDNQGAFREGDTIEITLTMSESLILGTTSGSKIIVDNIELYLDTQASDANNGQLVFTHTIQPGIIIAASDFKINDANDIILNGITDINNNAPDLSSITAPIQLLSTGPAFAVNSHTTFTSKGMVRHGSDYFTKTSGLSENWSNAEVTSDDSFVGDGYASAYTLTSSTEFYTMFGLTSRPNSNQGKLYNDIDYGISIGQHLLGIIESGSTKVGEVSKPDRLNWDNLNHLTWDHLTSIFTPYVPENTVVASLPYNPGDGVKVERVGTEIRYYHIDGTTKKETLLHKKTGVSADTKLYLDTVFYSSNSALTKVGLYQTKSVVVDSIAPIAVDLDPITGIQATATTFVNRKQIEAGIAFDDDIAPLYGTTDIKSIKVVLGGASFNMKSDKLILDKTIALNTDTHATNKTIATIAGLEYHYTASTKTLIITKTSGTFIGDNIAKVVEAIKLQNTDKDLEDGIRTATITYIDFAGNPSISATATLDIGLDRGFTINGEAKYDYNPTFAVNLHTAYTSKGMVRHGSDYFTKTSGLSETWGNAEVTSNDSFVGDGYASAYTLTSTARSYTIFGLTSSPHSNQDKLYKDIDYGIYIKYGIMCIIESGTERYTVAALRYTIGDGLKVERVGTEIHYYNINGTTKKETLLHKKTGVSADTKLYLDTVFYSSNSALTKVGLYESKPVVGAISSAGDVNGDGLDDLIVGATGAGTKGKSYVVFGTTHGTAIELSAIASGTGGFVINGEAAAGGWSGTSVSSAGDVNGDGLDDVIVGDFAANGLVGKSYVVFGKTNTTAINLSAIVNGTGGFVINGEVDGDKSGYSVSSAGDVNGDGLDDLIIGVLYNNEINTGKSYVVFGKSANNLAIDLGAIANGTGGFVINGEGATQSGYSVSSAGDVNGDGLDDLIVGSKGKSYVVFGSADTNTVDLKAIENGTGGFAIKGQIGRESVSSAGDVNGDGLDDLIVGAYAADSDKGKSYVVFGKTDITAIDLKAIASGTGGFVINGEAKHDKSGYSVSSAGDVNGDGLDDLIVGAYAADSDKGKSYVVFGKTDITAIDLKAIASGTGGFVIKGKVAGDKSGYSVSSAGDVNGDGLDDLIVGAPSASKSVGKSYVIFGKTDTKSVDLATLHSDSKYKIDFHNTSGTGNTFTGTIKDEIFVTGAGNDTLIGNGGMDVFNAGSGNDVIVINDSNIVALEKTGTGNRARVDGGGNIDTLKLDGANLALDLRIISNTRIQNIEKINIVGSGVNLLALTLNDLLALTSSANELIVLGNEGDVVRAIGFAMAGTSKTINGQWYQLYTHNNADVDANVKLWIGGSGVKISNVNHISTIVIRGIASEYQELSARITDVDGVPTTGISYQWMADGTDIADATSKTYTLTPAEHDKKITVSAHFTDKSGVVENPVSAETQAVSDTIPPLPISWSRNTPGQGNERVFIKGEVIKITLTISEDMILGNTEGSKIIIDGKDFQLDKSLSSGKKLVFTHTVTGTDSISAANFSIKNVGHVTLNQVADKEEHLINFKATVWPVELSAATLTPIVPNFDIVKMRKEAGTYTKMTGGNDWNAELYSTEGFTGDGYALAQFNSTNKQFMFGLSHENINSGKNRLDYALYMSGNQIKRIYNNGVTEKHFNQDSDQYSYKVGDYIKVERSGLNIHYYFLTEKQYKDGQTGTLLGTTVASSTTKTLHIDSTFRDEGVSIKNVQIVDVKDAVSVDGIAPFVTAMVFDSDAGIYHVGDTFTIKVTMSETTLVDTTQGTPKIKLTIGDTDTDRYARYSSGTNSKNLVFTYTVQVGDHDGNGIDIAQNALISDHGVLKDISGNTMTVSSSKVVHSDGIYIDTPATLVSWSINTTPQSLVFGVGDEVEVTFILSKKLIFNTIETSLIIIDGIKFDISVGKSDADNKKLVFTHTVIQGDNISDADFDIDKIEDIKLNGITDQSGDAPVLSAETFPIKFDTKPIVDTTAPIVVSAAITTEYASTKGSLTVGEKIIVHLITNEIITVNTENGEPTYLINVGGAEKTAIYESGTGTDTLKFSYTIKSGDNKGGITASANALTLHGSSLKDNAGNNINITVPEAETNELVVDPTLPATPMISLTDDTGTVTNTTNDGSLTVGHSDATDVKIEYFVTKDSKKSASNPMTKEEYQDYISNAGDGSYSVEVVATNTDDSKLTATATINYILDTTAPTVNSVTITENKSATGGESKTLTVYDKIIVTLTMSETIIVNGKPTYTIDIGDTTVGNVNKKEAIYKSGSGTKELQFVYTIKPNDVDTSGGITASANALVRNNGTLQDGAGNDVNPAIAMPVVGANTNTIVVDAFLPEGFVINGNVKEAKSGYSVSYAGDVNGDGLYDVIVGATGVKLNYVIFGKTGGQSINLDDIIPNKAGFFIQNLKNGGSESIGLGYAVDGVRDVNGDGLDDLVVSVTHDDKTNKAYVVFGNAEYESVNLGTIGNAGFAINSESGDTSSFSIVGAGDVNGDGKGDFIIGAPDVRSDGSGKSYVVFGKSDNTEAIYLATLQSGIDGFTINGAVANGKSGTSVADAGDVNGDGLTDLIIGAPGEGNGLGKSYVVFGKSASKSNNDINLSMIANKDNEEGFVINGNDKPTENLSGCLVSSAGDVNGDGRADLIISAKITSAGKKMGKNYVVFGKTGGNSINLSQVEQGTGGFVINGEADEYFERYTISNAGDVNGDGLSDLLIGTRHKDADADKEWSGKHYVVFGKKHGIKVDLADINKSEGTGGFVIKGEESDGKSGFPVSVAGDVNGDGLSDFIVGADNMKVPKGYFGAGKSYVVFGKTDTKAVELHKLITGKAYPIPIITGTNDSDDGSENEQGVVLAPKLIGTSKSEIFVAKEGNDILIGNGGADVFHGGSGNDTIIVNASNIATLSQGLTNAVLAGIHGGTGVDTVKLEGADITLDLTSIANNRITGIEKIDLTGSGNNTLKLNLFDLIDSFGDNNLLADNNVLKVFGNGGDAVHMSAGFVKKTEEPRTTEEGVNYDIYTHPDAHTSANVALWVDKVLTVSIVDSSIL